MSIENVSACYEPENLKVFEENKCILQTLRDVITEIQNFELRRANQFVTRHTINLRVLKHVSDLLNLSWTYKPDEKSIYLHSDNAAKIDEKWNQCLKSNFHLSHEEMNAYKLIKTDDYVSYYDLIKFINILVRKDLVPRDPTSTEKILRNNDLNIILAVDGFSGHIPADMKNYIDNLQYGPGYDMHLDAIRKMYELEKIAILSGTDSACIIFSAVIQAFGKYITDDETKMLLKEISEDIMNYLIKNANYYRDIESCRTDLNELTAFYEDNMKTENLEQLAILKVANLIMRFKKKKPTLGSKRGRRKNLNPQKNKALSLDDQ